MPRTARTPDAASRRGSGRSAARRRTLRIAAAGLTAVAALTLTACGGPDGPPETHGAESFDPAPQDAKDPAPGNGGTAQGKGTGSASDGQPSSAPSGNAAGPDTATESGSGTADTGRHQPCDAARLHLTAATLTRPVNHLLLEVKNTSGSTCDLYAYPFLRFDDEQAPVASFDDSKPQAVVSLAPGDSGYAGVLTSSPDGGGAHGHTRTSLSVLLAGRDGQGSSGGAAQVGLPGGSAYIDDSAWVTYWQADPADATQW
ncbi:DUF4232 domain-containing protein [Streptomyces pinistramenti]|uniref:DUF4232 domain-containing protein n=1 Tax=Streptomyces pinistramenti TaxID=2884812 RepID=UPI001D0763BE|nr:DUF4232 domain-containing protein [Streptomyces pinistramenti]MCB5911352.1 DUF4232 domain-containing protein [Streptomyces pinistramenti]